MSPTPVTFATPNQPSSYTWEATNEEVAARYGVPLEHVVRFDLNTAPAPPDLAQRVIAAGRFDTSLSEYPPSDYRRLVDAAAARYGVGTDEIVVGCGCRRDPRHHRQDIPPRPSARPSCRSRRTRCSASSRSSAAPRPCWSHGSARARATRSTCRRCARPRVTRPSVAVLPNNPTALAEPDGAIETLLGRSWRRMRRPTAGPPRSSSSTRPMPSSPAGRSPACASTTRTSSSSGPSARPTRSRGCGSGSPSPGPSSSPA